MYKRSARCGFRFTEERLLQVKCPPPSSDEDVIDHRAYRTYWDTECPFLHARISSSGRRYYAFRKHWRGRRVTIHLGQVGCLRLEDARALAFKLTAQVAQDKPPKLRDGDELTIGELWRHYQKRSVGRVGAMKMKSIVRNWERFFKRWEQRRASDVSFEEIVQFHSKLGNRNGPVAANSAVAYLSTWYSMAVEIGYRGINPCLGVPRYQEKPRERFLSREEVARLMGILDGTEYMSELRDLVCLALYTGARRSNLCDMAWRDINFDSRVWTIPKTKNGDAVQIPLVPEAMEVLERRRAAQKRLENPFRKPAQWVFLAGTTVKRWKRCADFKQQFFDDWQAARKLADLEDVRFHDLRRTHASWQAMTGASLVVIGKGLGHRSLKATQIYARMDLSPVREAMGKAVEAMRGAPPEDDFSI